MKRFLQALKWAWLGIWQALKEERHMKIHFCIATLVIVAGIYFSILPWQWVALLLTIGMVVVSEMINTAIERVVDLVTAEYHPLAAAAKNIAAGSVLLAAILSMVIGMIIFLPYIGKIF